MRMNFLLIVVAGLFSLDVYGGNQKVVLMVEGMTCPSCAASVEKQLKALPQVNSVDISLSKGSVTVTAKDGAALSEKDISKAIEAAGYKVKSQGTQKAGT